MEKGRGYVKDASVMLKMRRKYVGRVENESVRIWSRFCSSLPFLYVTSPGQERPIRSEWMQGDVHCSMQVRRVVHERAPC